MRKDDGFHVNVVAAGLEAFHSVLLRPDTGQFSTVDGVAVFVQHSHRDIGPLDGVQLHLIEPVPQLIAVREYRLRQGHVPALPQTRHI